jgi:hypothetical protein
MGPAPGARLRARERATSCDHRKEPRQQELSAGETMCAGVGPAPGAYGAA